MKKSLRWLAWCLVLSLGVMVGGCADYAIDQQPDEEPPEQNSEAQTLVFGTTLSSDLLDPTYSYASWYDVRYGILETLFRFDENLVPQPWLAKSYKNIDERTWEVVLRDDVSFSNGKPMTAQAVVAAWEYCRQNNDLMMEQIVSADFEVDGKKITIRTEKPSPTLIHDLADPFMVVFDVTAGENYDNDIIGTGPYVVDEYIGRSSCKLYKNENYWGEKPTIDRIEIRLIADSDTLTMALQSGDIDWAQGVTAENVAMFEDSDKYTISTVPTSRVYMAYLNLNREFLQSQKVRMALALAMNKESFCQQLLGGAATASDAVFPSSLPYGDGAVEGYGFDLARAKALLEEDGWINENGVLKKNGVAAPTLRIVASTQRKEVPLLAEAVEAQLKQLGISCAIENTADDTRSMMKEDDFDIGFYVRVTAAVGDAYNMLASTYQTGGDSNYAHYSNPQVDQLLEELSVEYDNERRTQLAIEIQNILNQDIPAINFCHLNLSMITKANVHGVVSHPTDYYQVTNRITMD